MLSASSNCVCCDISIEKIKGSRLVGMRGFYTGLGEYDMNIIEIYDTIKRKEVCSVVYVHHRGGKKETTIWDTTKMKSLKRLRRLLGVDLY